jgi:small multidrug resistance pump
MGYVLLVIAIALEVAATVALRMSEGFSRATPAVFALLGYAMSLGLLSLAMKTVPLSISYPMWAGIGTAGALAAAWFLFGERLALVQWLGAAFVLAGVIAMNVPRSTAGGAA